MINFFSSLDGEQRRWAALIAGLLAQLMIVLDATIVNVALPSIQHDLHFSQSSLTWVVNAYLITFGSLDPYGGGPSGPPPYHVHDAHRRDPRLGREADVLL